MHVIQDRQAYEQSQCQHKLNVQCITCCVFNVLWPFHLAVPLRDQLLFSRMLLSQQTCVTEIEMFHDFSEANARSRFQFSGSPPWISLPAESRVVCLAGKWKPSQLQAPHPQSLQNEDGLLRLSQAVYYEGLHSAYIGRVSNGQHTHLLFHAVGTY